MTPALTKTGLFTFATFDGDGSNYKVMPNDDPTLDLVYSDEDKMDVAGRLISPFFKPDWSPEHFLGQMYTCHLTVARTAFVRALGGFRLGTEGSQDYDLWLRFMEKTSGIIHVPKVLYHWRKIPGSAAAE